MTSVANAEVRERVIRWIEEGQSLLGILLGFLYEHERARKRADAAEAECDRLREEVDQLRAETERYRSERVELADSLAQFTNEVLARLRA